jgi:UDP-galactopyranose mutase
LRNKNIKYDFLIVGSGLFGCVFAHEATKQGKTCLIIEKRNHVGGNIYCEKINGVNVHKYGPHIFHTNDKNIWDYVNSFVPFNSFINSPLANYKGELFNLPFNMNTFHQLWNIKTPEQAIEKLETQKVLIGKKAENLEEQALSTVGKDIYHKLIKGYTEKQWGRPCKDLPAGIIKRIPLRFEFNNNYYNDTYQGVPIGGYNKLIDGLLKDIEVITEVDYLKDRKHWDRQAKKIVFTGRIDAFYDYSEGELSYRSMRWEHKELDTSDYQGTAIVNYTDSETKYTRIIEHKHFEFGTQSTTVISKEFPSETKYGDEPHYPINDNENQEIYYRYATKSKAESNIIFGGRLAEYKYYDMHQVIASALTSVKKNVTVT